MKSIRNFGGAWALWAAGLIAFSCATVNEPTIVQPPSAGPQVSASLAEQPAHRLKRKVVIARFSNETPYGKSVLLGENKSLIGQMASDILASRLTQTDLFLLFERTDSERVLASLDGGDIDSLNLKADYLIVGSLSEFGRNTTGETGVFSRSKVQRAYARVNVRLVDVRTGEVIFSQEGAGEAEIEAGTTMGVGTKAGYDSTLDSKAISAAVSKLVSNLVENLTAQPWRSYVIARKGEDLVIAGGASQGLKAGDRLFLVKRGERVENPQTGLPLELPGEEAAEIEVASLFGDTPATEGAICRVVQGTAPADDFEAYIVQEVKP